MNNALKAITSVQQDINLDISTDLFSIDIRNTCVIRKHYKKYDVDKDILNKIFGGFCIG